MNILAYCRIWVFFNLDRSLFSDIYSQISELGFGEIMISSLEMSSLCVLMVNYRVGFYIDLVVEKFSSLFL